MSLPNNSPLKSQRSLRSKNISTHPTPERIRIAQVLHDGIAQDLVGVGYSLDLLLSRADLTPSARVEVRTSRLEIDDLLSKVRSEILNLRRGSEDSLHRDIESLARSIVCKEVLICEISEVSASPELSEALLAIAGELLRNSVKHARASRIEVHLYPINNLICLEISDNGIGGAQMKEGHWGLTGLYEQVKSLDGRISMESPPGKGTRIAIAI